MADEAFAETGVSSSYAFLIMTVCGKPGLQAKEISFHMQLTPSTVTRLIEKMEYKGYLERKSVGRETQVYPLEKAKKLNLKIKKAWKNFYEEYTEMLGEEKAVELTQALNAAYQKIDTN